MRDEVKYDLPAGLPSSGGRRWLLGVAVFLLGGIGGFLIRSPRGSAIASGAAVTPGATASLLSSDELKKLAESLERNQLYAEAARSWERAAALDPPAGTDKAETLFRIGKNFSLANDHEKAIAYLFAAEAADTEQRWKPSINKLVLEGFSALGREDVRAQQAAKRIDLDSHDGESPKIVAEIGKEPVSELDLQAFARQLVTQQLSMQRQFMDQDAFEAAVKTGLERFKEAEGRKQLLQMYLSRELLYREALAAGLPDDQQVIEETVNARRQILTEAFLDKYLQEHLHVDDMDVTNAYEAKKAEYVEPEAFKVDALVVDGEEAKDKATAALEAGDAFSEVRDQFSTLKPDAGTSNPFDRWIPRDGWVPLAADGKAALAHVIALQPGEVGDKWIEGTGGKWLRFKLAEHRPERPLPLEECRDRVNRDLRAEKQKSLLQQLQQSLQGKYKVVIHEDALPPVTPDKQEEGS